jgi:hypothetical protein
MPKPHNKSSLRIDPRWCKHQAYSDHFQALCDTANLSTLPLCEQRPLLLEYMREAAMLARDHVLDMEPDSHISILTRLSSIARAVWSSDSKLMHTLCKKSELARSHLTPTSQGPSLINPAKFEEDILKAKADHLAQDAQSLNAATQNTDTMLGKASRASKHEHIS